MGDNKAQRGLKIAGISIILLLGVFVAIQWTLGLDKLILWEYVSWSYEGSHFDFEMGGMMADSFWSRHVYLESFSFKQPQSHYDVSHTSVIHSDSPEGERVQILAQVMYTAEHSEDEDPGETMDLVLSYRFMGLRRTLSKSIMNILDIKRVAYDLLHASEKQMITDWRLATIDEVRVNQWSEETTFRVVFPTKSDAVFEHLAVYVPKDYKKDLTDLEDNHVVDWWWGEAVVRGGLELFDLNIYTNQDLYTTEDRIDIYATLEYIGNSESIKIWHGIPYLQFYIIDGKGFSTVSYTSLVLTSTRLVNGTVYRFDLKERTLGVRGHAKEGTLVVEGLPGDNLVLPAGEYTVGVYLDFSLSPSSIDDNYTPPRKEVQIRVIEDTISGS